MPTAIVETEVIVRDGNSKRDEESGWINCGTGEAEKSAQGHLKVIVAAESAKEMTAQKEHSSPVAEVLEASVQEESEVRAPEESVTAITTEPGAAQADEKGLKPAVFEEQDAKFTLEETQQQVSMGQQAAVNEPTPRKRDLEGATKGIATKENVETPVAEGAEVAGTTEKEVEETKAWDVGVTTAADEIAPDKEMEERARLRLVSN